MTYRTAPMPRRASLDLRPSPVSIGVLVAVSCPIFLFPGTMAMIGSVGRGFGPALMGLPFVGAGIGLGVLAYRMLSTVVRFQIDDRSVSIEWRRAGRYVRSELLPREDVIDVAIDEQASSGGDMLCRLVVGTRNGDIPLAHGFTNDKAHYRRSVARLHAFLGVPVR